jgi:hypothetical protein
VYLGSEKVWPNYVANLSPWYSPGVTHGAGTSYIIVPWPAGAEFVDVIAVGGGAGGTGTGVAGNRQLGGGQGVWKGWTIPRTGEQDSAQVALTYHELWVQCNAVAGQDGVGGGNFSTEAADGSATRIVPRGRRAGEPNATYVGPERTTGNSQDKTSNTGNRNGGNVDATFVYNGRTYTMASYGTNAGRGGATSNKNGGDGNRPGGGGQSADDGGLTGYNGGKGAHGAAILYWY